ncbi:Hypothetical protein NCDO2118_0323 [Lactococcus lactis subsp. lactis NCDO 2118]|uniref:Uncharacterized protein n=1 Tax=Lactococcus lactis subsp. lactis NCDO 2118 TaxID=1117941 RepID=A0ABC8A3K3_LACLL|nr:hypothetical protein [Lactococcus lactis]ADA64089.1 Hypothetical protein LLKF_0319 [Lactococcus lactis subsp. lactis KF147]AII11822.1 Hypothetical protein NCDO2118_0323 [Lactococcus lactis subsp. lactis NCDO 2118]
MSERTSNRYRVFLLIKVVGIKRVLLELRNLDVITSDELINFTQQYVGKTGEVEFTRKFADSIGEVNFQKLENNIDLYLRKL